MSKPAQPPALRVRRATRLDLDALREWTNAFALLRELNPTSSAPATEFETGENYIVLLDALRVAFVTCTDATGETPPYRLFLKPAAWSRVSRAEVIAAVSAHRATRANAHPADRKPVAA